MTVTGTARQKAIAVVLIPLVLFQIYTWHFGYLCELAEIFPSFFLHAALAGAAGHACACFRPIF